jgi:hypothetical protein
MIEIYWAPVFKNDNNVDWNILYYELESLYDSIRPFKEESNPRDNFFYCPSFSNLAKSTFLLKNPIESHFKFNQHNQLEAISKNYINSEVVHPPSLKDSKLLVYGMKWVFFCKDDVELTLSSPFFTKTNSSNYGCVVPGSLKINSWFRTVSLEYNLWPGVNEIHFLEDEILAYVSFKTDEKIKLTRFEVNDKLHGYLNATSSSVGWESWVPLKKRYDRFMKTRMHKLVLNEIQKNIVE